MYALSITVKPRGVIAGEVNSLKSVQQGQERLEELNESVAKDNMGIGVIKVENVNVFTNPFPDWFDELIRHMLTHELRVSFKFDDINYAYMIMDEDQAKLQKVQNWFYTVYLNWEIKQANPARIEFSKHVEVKIMDTCTPDNVIHAMNLHGF